MARIRELQPAHKSDKLTVSQAARAFRTVQNSSQEAKRDARARRIPNASSGDCTRKNGRGSDHHHDPSLAEAAA